MDSVRPGFPEHYGGLDDPAANVIGFETMAYSDLSLLVVFGVRFGLWGGVVFNLGTPVHHDRYLSATAAGEFVIDRESERALLRSRTSSETRASSFFLEHDRLAGARTKQITREVNALCDAVSRQAGALVDAFGIPDQVLSAPIGLGEPVPTGGSRG